MRHAPYTTSATAVATVIVGEELETRMAISATATAEDSWFGSGGDAAGRRVNIRFGSGDGGTNGIVADLDEDGEVNDVRSAANEFVRLGSEIREVNFNNSDDDDEIEEEEEEVVVGENEKATTEESQRKVCDRQRATSRFFFSTFGALSGREKWPFRRKKSHYPFKRKRKPGLSNVIEIYENAPASAAGTNSVVPEIVIDDGGGGGGGGGDETVDGGSNAVRENTTDTIAAAAAVAAAAVSGRLNGDGGDDDVDFERRLRRSSSTSSCSGVHNGCAVPDANADRSATTARQRRRTFTCLLENDPDDDAADGETDRLEERLVLVPRSVSVSNDETLSGPFAKLCSTSGRMFNGDDDDDDDDEDSEDVDEHVKMLGDAKSLPSVIKSSSTTTTTTTTSTSTVGSGSKLGKWSKSKIDLLVPSLKSFVTMTTSKLSTSKPANLNSGRRGDVANGNNFCPSIEPIKAALKRNISLNSVPSSAGENGLRPLGRDGGGGSTDNLAADFGATGRKLRKSNTMVTLPGSGCMARTPSGVLHVEPLRPQNRLRPGSREQFPAASKMCSRCSSILSMASSSKYSLNSSYGFVPVSSPSVLCKVCLNEVPLKDSWTLQHCECSYCVDCVRSYVEFEINQGAYSISCPDAQCENLGIILLEEIESLVSLENVEKHKRYRLNREVEMDKSRTWCPRAGCETVCTLCTTDRCTPQSVHCPTCHMDFCSNCRAAWHADSPCKSEEVVPGVTFDSELIKCCPVCSVPIEKDEGCAQMLCKRCKHVFCWYCLASLDDDFLLRHYDKGPCKNKLGHSRASVIWHRTQVISIFAGFGILLLIASPLLLLAAPCIVCCKCRVCSSDTKLDVDDDIPEAAEIQTNTDPSSSDKEATTSLPTTEPPTPAPSQLGS